MWHFLLGKSLPCTSDLQIAHCLITCTWVLLLITHLLSISIKVMFGLDLHDLFQPAMQLQDCCSDTVLKGWALLFIDRLPNLHFFYSLIHQACIGCLLYSNSDLKAEKGKARCGLFLPVASSLVEDDPMTCACNTD